MTTPILNAVSAISPTYQPTTTQLRDMDNAPDPQAVADGLVATVTALRKAIATELSDWGVTTDDVTADIVLAIVYFKATGGGFSTGENLNQSKRLGSRVFADLIAAGTRRSNPLADPEIVAAYDEIEGRYPDRSGHAFWAFHKISGMGIDTIRRMMRASKA